MRLRIVISASGLVLMVLLGVMMIRNETPGNVDLPNEWQERNGMGSASGQLIVSSKEGAKKEVEIDHLWHIRRTESVNDKLMKYLPPSEESLLEKGNNIVRWIGLTGDVHDLENLLRIQKENKSNTVRLDPANLQIAISNLRTPDLKGKQKIEAVLGSIGLTWKDITAISKSQNYKNARYTGDPQKTRLIWTVIEMLYVMEKSGQDVSSLKKDLSLTPYSQVKLRCGEVGADKEVEVIGEYLYSANVVYEPDIVTDDMVSLGKPTTEFIKKFLMEMKSNYAECDESMGYVPVFRAAVEMNIPEALSIIKYFADGGGGQFKKYHPGEPGYYVIPEAKMAIGGQDERRNIH